MGRSTGRPSASSVGTFGVPARGQLAASVTLPVVDILEPNGLATGAAISGFNDLSRNIAARESFFQRINPKLPHYVSYVNSFCSIDQLVHSRQVMSRMVKPNLRNVFFT